MDLIITIVLIAGFVCYQYRQYKITKNALTDYRNLFPLKDEFQIMQEEQFPVIIANSSHTCYDELVRETNHYIKENRNTFELNTLKEIVNRRVLQEYEIASAKINTPMSLGADGYLYWCNYRSDMDGNYRFFKIRRRRIYY
ncbi:MAG: hypothetical protein LIP01_00305 [Tannerellaceae bacterium]|nr:hypothetical protein [Tannerellaceae bacterium]